MEAFLFDLLKIGPKFMAAGVLVRAVVQIVRGAPLLGSFFNTEKRLKTLVGLLAFGAVHFYQIDAGSALGLVSGVSGLDQTLSAALLAYWAMYAHDRLKNGKKTNGNGAPSNGNRVDSRPAN